MRSSVGLPSSEGLLKLPKPGPRWTGLFYILPPNRGWILSLACDKFIEQVYEHFDSPDFNPEASPSSALPPGLAEMAPGPELGRLLSDLDSIPLSGYERALLVAAHRRMVSSHQA